MKIKQIIKGIALFLSDVLMAIGIAAVLVLNPMLAIIIILKEYL